MDSPWRVFAVWGSLLIVGCLGMAQLRVDTETSAFLDRSSPLWSTYQKSIEEFGSDEFITVAIMGEAGFEPKALNTVRYLTKAASGLAGVERVDSVASVTLPSSEDDGAISFNPLVDEEADPEVSQSLSAWAEDHSELAPWLISEDGKVIAINIYVDEAFAQTKRDSVRLVRVLGERAGGITSGVPVFRSAVNSRTISELTAFLPLTAALVLGACFAVFRSVRFLLIQAICAGCGVVLTLGLMGAIGITVSLATLPLPAILVAISAAYSIHLSAASVVGGQEVRASICQVAVPLVISGLTTAIGFASMAVVGIGAIRELAIFGACGVITVLVATLTIGPAIIATWSGGVREARIAFGQMAARRLGRLLIGFSVRHPAIVVCLWMVFFAIGSAGMFRLTFDSNIIHWFPRGDEVRENYEKIRSTLSGITPVNILVERIDGGRISGSDVLAIDKFVSHVRTQAVVGAALSVGDLVQSLNEAWTGSNSLPESDTAISQYLVVLEGSAWWPRLVSSDGTVANVPVLLDSNTSEAIMTFSEGMLKWWSRSFGERYHVRVTGIMFEFARSQDAISRGQVQGLLIAAGVIALIMWATFRSVVLAVAAFVPTVPPIVAVYGSLGILGVPLDAATASIGAVAVGLAVDDSLHLGTAYEREMVKGRSGMGSLRRAFGRTLPVLLLTTVAVSIGFGVFGLSDFAVIRIFGVVTAVIVILCFAADATLFPALLAMLMGSSPGVSMLGSERCSR